MAIDARQGPDPLPMQTANNYYPSKPERSASTIEDYEQEYRRQAERLAREANVVDPTPDEVVADLISRHPTLAMSTWRYKKAAVLHYIETYHPEHQTAIEELRQLSSAGLPKTSNKTSGRKLKHVPSAAWREIQRVLQGRIADGYRHAEGLLTVLRATLLCGLRPIEWSQATIATHAGTSRTVLRVGNAKHSDGRANGEYRELFIDELTADEQATIRAAVAYCSTATHKEAVSIKVALKSEMETVRMLAGTSSRRASSSVTMYSFRHQFIADAKQTFESPLVLSATVGHSSTKTAFEHYGKRRFGRGKVRVYPTPESVAAVQTITLETYNSFLSARQAGQRPAPR